MIPWIQVYSNLPSHPKTATLAQELKLTSSVTSPTVIASGLLVGIWTWAIQNAYDGDLSKCSPAVIADACRWKKKPETLIAALRKAGFLDDDMRLHDWEEYAVLMIDSEDNRREKTRERVRRYREKKRIETSELTCQYCGAPATGYDHIIPLSKGGRDTEDNLVPCCPRCNSAKQDRPLVTFLNRHMDWIDIDSVTDCEKLLQHVRYDEISNRFVTVTCNECNAPTGQDRTIHNITEQDNKLLSQSGGGNKTISEAEPTLATPPEKEDAYGFGEDLKNAVRDWVDYKRQRKQTVKPAQIKALLDQAKGYADKYGEEATASIIRYSIGAGYSGIVFDRLDKQPPGKKTKTNPYYSGYEYGVPQTPTDEELEKIRTELSR